MWRLDEQNGRKKKKIKKPRFECGALKDRPCSLPSSCSKIYDFGAGKKMTEKMVGSGTAGVVVVVFVIVVVLLPLSLLSLSDGALIMVMSSVMMIAVLVLAVTMVTGTDAGETVARLRKIGLLKVGKNEVRGREGLDVELHRMG